MAIEVLTVKRQFIYNGMTLPDVPGLSPVDVRDLYSAQFPELISAEVQIAPPEHDQQIITFRRAVGTKG